jgi:putative redox protein
MKQGSDIANSALSTRTGTFKQRLTIRDHQLVADEPLELGGSDEGPSPLDLLAASLASCTAVTMEMYAAHKGWDIGDIEVSATFTPADRGCPTRFKLDLRFPENLSEEQIQRLRVIAAKCPVHRVLEGEVMFDERVESTQLTS